MNRVVRTVVTVAGLIALWQAIVWISGAPPYLLPSPLETAIALTTRSGLIAGHALVTLSEILAGLVLGTALGVLSAVVIALFRPARRWLMPLLVTSQAIPVFAIAPLLVLWLGYGMASKVGMATLIIYFPVASSFLDGLRRTETRWIDLAHTMTGGPQARPFAVLLHVRLPAALPAFASGLRVAAAVAPIGAVVGEWVGSGAGLGYLMLQANARVQIDLMFAALLTLAALAVTLYFLVDLALRKAIPWQPDTLPEPDP
jgi:putative hydroxymethylpyrimidine transport system permease protein